jgi:hypothetical protein
MLYSTSTGTCPAAAAFVTRPSTSRVASVPVVSQCAVARAPILRISRASAVRPSASHLVACWLAGFAGSA